MSIAEATAELTAPGQPFETGREWVGGVEVRVWRNCPLSLRSVLESSVVHGEATFLVYEDERVSFRDQFEQAAALAWLLSTRYGVARGDRVAIAMRNLPEWVVAFWAAAALGAVIVPLNAWWTGSELAYGLDDSGTKVAIVDFARLTRMSPHLDDLRRGGLEQVLVARLEEQGAELPTVPGTARYEEAIVSGRLLARAAGEGGRLPPAEILPDDDATIFYTSGTTGKPKGALGTQRNICTNIMSLGFINARSGLMATEEQRRLRSAAAAQSSYLL